MSGILLRWGVPALATVIGGTAIALLTTGASISDDLASRSRAAVSDSTPWLEVTFDGRDAIVAGTVADEASVEGAIAEIAAVHGVRSVTSAAVLAEFASPFPFEATVEDGQLFLKGGVPDEAALEELLGKNSAEHDGLRVMAGAPERDAWLEAAGYVIETAMQLEEGEVALADLNLTISGRAKSVVAFDALQQVAGGNGLPPDLTIGKAEIIPPLASPYEWSARFDGAKIEISGYKTGEEFVERLRIADIGGRPVATSMVLASGAPSGFEDNAVLLLQNLLQLERGEASISDDEMTLTGAPADAETADKVRAAMTKSGTKVVLEPTKVREFLLSGRAVNGTITLSGFVPDQATKDRLEDIDGVDAAALELARGAPERFESGADFIIDALSHMSEGTVRLEGTSITMEGRAATQADFAELRTTVSLGAPQGLILKSSNILPPLASPFVWTAAKTTGGTIDLSGYVPDEATKDAQHEAAAIGADTTTIADGEPDDFTRLSVAALDVLETLDTGKVGYDGATWSVTGAVDTTEKGAAALSLFNAAGLRYAGWSYTVSLPEPKPAAVLPIIDPYTWRAQKSADGAVTFTGFLPSETVQNFLARRAGDKVTVSSALGAGAPETFVKDALVGVDALAQLDEGTLAFADGRWTLTGQTETGTTRLAIQDALLASVDGANWNLAIQAEDGAPLVEPFTWSAAKSENGRVSLSGYVTTEELRNFVAVRAGNVVSDTTQLASGEPAGFMADVLAGLDALEHLHSGSVTFDGKTFALVGVPGTAANRDAALAALSTASDGGTAWVKNLAQPVTAPEPNVAAAPEPTPEAMPAEGPASEPTTEAALPPAETPAAAPAAADISFEASKVHGGQIALKGDVPADTTRKYFGIVAGDVPTDDLVVAANMPEDFVTGAVAGIRTLGLLSDGSLDFDGTNWALQGQATTEAERTAALAELAAVPATKDWQTSITLVPPIDICREKVTAFASRNAILFQSGSARITDESGPALDELAGYLNACPEATVHVEGHTDADGDEALNLALSVSRAEAVVNALIDRGVSYARLYAVGYGESMPIESNDTRAGKQANRRIAFTILDEQQ